MNTRHALVVAVLLVCSLCCGTTASTSDADVITLQSEVAALRVQLAKSTTDNYQAVLTLNIQIAALQKTSAAAVTALAALQTRVSTLEVAAAAAAPIAALTALTTRIATTESNITALATAITAAQAADATVTARVTAAETAATTLTARVDQEELLAAALTARVTNAEANITAIASQTSGVESTASLLTARVAIAEANLTLIESSAAALTSRVDTVESTLVDTTSTANSAYTYGLHANWRLTAVETLTVSEAYTSSPLLVQTIIALRDLTGSSAIVTAVNSTASAQATLAATVATHTTAISNGNQMLGFLTTKPTLMLSLVGEGTQTVSTTIKNFIITMDTAVMTGTGATDSMVWDSATSQVTLYGATSADADAGLMRRFAISATVCLADMNSVYLDFTLLNTQLFYTFDNYGSVETQALSGTFGGVVPVASNATLTTALKVGNVAIGAASVRGLSKTFFTVTLL